MRNFVTFLCFILILFVALVSGDDDGVQKTPVADNNNQFMTTVNGFTSVIGG
jgi:hypothetical protein